MDNFNLEEHYKTVLSRVKGIQSNEDMLKLSRFFFFNACYIMFNVVTNKISDLSEEQACIVLDDLGMQTKVELARFAMNETKQKLSDGVKPTDLEIAMILEAENFIKEYENERSNQKEG